MIKTALIGFGLSGRVFHAPLIDTNPKMQLAGIYSSRVDEIKEKYSQVKVYGDLKEIFDDVIDLVVITSPNEFHFEQAKQFLEAGVHVIVEKPFVINTQEADELVALAKSKNLVLSVYHNRRFDGDFLTIQKLIEEDKFGSISYFESHFDRHRPFSKNLGWREEQKPGSGFLYDLGSHLIDQMLVLFGQPQSVFADIANMRENTTVDDYFHLIFYYEKMRAVLHSTNIGPKSDLRFKVDGTKASYVKYKLDPQESALKAGKVPSIDKWGEEEDLFHGTLYTEEKELVIPTEKGCYQQYYDQVASAILEGTPNPVNPQEAADVISIIEACFESSIQKKIIDLT
jgi:scyllo-inositol 2-dehydrogenase (NADP+)